MRRLREGCKDVGVYLTEKQPFTLNCGLDRTAQIKTKLIL